MRWLHRFLNDVQQLLTQLFQVNFVAQCVAESGQDLLRVILSTIETAIDDRLDTTA